MHIYMHYMHYVYIYAYTPTKKILKWEIKI